MIAILMRANSRMKQTGRGRRFSRGQQHPAGGRVGLANLAASRQLMRER
jgi:hypothetical protein